MRHIESILLQKVLSNRHIQKRDRARNRSSDKEDNPALMMKISANHPMHQTGHMIYLKQILKQQGISI
ncbi:MAG: hypothetical protein QME40_00500 [bacterium]|nr:hypothetical protein [bacterium]